MDNSLATHPAKAAVFMLVLALATILGAWGSELIGGFVPCKLCLQERIPYYVGIPVLAAAVLAAATGRSGMIVRLLVGVAALIFLIGLGQGGYHAGVEWSWWAGPSDCGAGAASATQSADDLLQQLQGIRIVSCSEASWRFPAGWGLSFAGWNAAVCAVLAAAGFYGVARRA
jgi:disulfide bond formation protein DsbB